MSMDDVYEHVSVLQLSLEQFNTTVRQSFAKVNESHRAVAPLWEDEMGRQYQQRREPLDEVMGEYVQRVGPAYVDLLVERMRYLRLYLHGHGA